MFLIFVVYFLVAVGEVRVSGLVRGSVGGLEAAVIGE